MVTGHEVLYWSEWVLRVVMLVYVPQRRSAAAARGWLLLIFLLPIPGVILYSVIGRPFLPRRRVALQERMSTMIREEQASWPKLEGLPAGCPAPMTHVMDLAQNLGDFRIFPGNAIELLDDYEGAIDRLVADIDAATHHVHLLYYIFADDRTGRRGGGALVGGGGGGGGGWGMRWCGRRGVGCRAG